MSMSICFSPENNSCTFVSGGQYRKGEIKIRFANAPVYVILYGCNISKHKKKK